MMVNERLERAMGRMRELIKGADFGRIVHVQVDEIGIVEIYGPLIREFCEETTRLTTERDELLAGLMSWKEWQDTNECFDAGCHECQYSLKLFDLVEKYGGDKNVRDSR